MIIMALALLPLLALAAWQGMARFERERQVTQARLDDRAEIVAASRLNPLRSTAALLELLAADEQTRRAVHPACATTLQTTSAAFSHVTGVAVAAPDGAIACSSGETAAGIGRLLGPAPPLPLPGAPRIRVTVPRAEPGLRDGTLLMALRLDDGTRIAALVDPVWLEGLAGTLDGRFRYAVSLIDGNGQVLASSRALDWDVIDPAVLKARTPMADASGRLWLHGGATLSDGRVPEETVRILLSQPEPEPFDSNWMFNVSYVLLPLLALMLAWLAIWIGADRSILRWVRDIGAVADEIGRAQRIPADERFVQAPHEIRSLAAQLKRVARIIADRDQFLRRAAEQQRLSALELNHRVRNNLQIIGSWLAMERAQLPAGETGEAMDRVAMRVAAISLVHRLLYDGPEPALPGPSALVAPLCQLLQRHGIGQPLTCDAQTIADPVGIDTAVQMSLWLVEAGLAMPPEAAVRPLTVRLSADPHTIRLALILDDGTGHVPAALPVPPVLRSIARQMGGTTEAMAMPHHTDRLAALHLVMPRHRLAGMQSFSAK